ncbi:Metacaspase-2 [Hibiscus syriacus]|uniref:Metacaspase-2 n=1 Tax=Hibiscus syriacus TaxID=106335 RepID=A0A6A2YE64_HIBSY|nr:Metacaspase-2 [Hibiscus syriacus]
MISKYGLITVTVPPGPFAVCKGKPYSSPGPFVVCKGKSYSSPGPFVVCKGKPYSSPSPFAVCKGKPYNSPGPFAVCKGKPYSSPRSLCCVQGVSLTVSPGSFAMCKYKTLSFLHAPMLCAQASSGSSILLSFSKLTLLLTIAGLLMSVNCSNCHAPLQLPPAAKSIRCFLCQAITLIVRPRSLPFPSSSTHTLSPPLPYNHVPPGRPPQVHGRKRAVICGVSYKNTHYELNGCINGANCMKFFLVHRFNFPESSIITLTEEETDPYKRPTKRNIRMALRWLVQGFSLEIPWCSITLVMHGSQQKDDNGDEVDGYGGTLCPSDFESQGMIVDDEINATIVRPLPHGVKLHAIALSKITSTGAMAYSFIEVVERGHATTYGNMLNAMRSNIRKSDDDGFVTTLLTMLLSGERLGGDRDRCHQTCSIQSNHRKEQISIDVRCCVAGTAVDCQ